MPQLNPADFLPQIVWLAITFGLLYFLMARIALPRVGEVIEARAARIAADLDRAAALKAEAEQARDAYEKALAEARASAQALTRKVETEAAGIAAARQAELGAQLADRIKVAEGRIAAARIAALAAVDAVAGEAARAAVERIAGIDVPAAEAARAAAAALAERA